MITKPKKWNEMKGSMWHKCKATVILCIWKVKPINYCALYCWEKAKQMTSKVREKELKCKFHVADMHVLCPVLERQFFRKRVFYWFEEESRLLLNNIRNKVVQTILYNFLKIIKLRNQIISLPRPQFLIF